MSFNRINTGKTIDWQHKFSLHFKAAYEVFSKKQGVDWEYAFKTRCAKQYANLSDRQLKLITMMKEGDVFAIDELKPTLKELLEKPDGYASQIHFAWQNRHYAFLHAIYEKIVLPYFAHEKYLMLDTAKTDSSGIGIIQYAIMCHQSVDTLKLLFMQGCDFNSKHQDKSLLAFASFVGHEEAVNYLLAFGANDPSTNDGALAMYFAAQEGHLNTVKRLVENDVDVNRKTDNRSTIIHASARCGHIDIFNYLQEKGAVFSDKEVLIIAKKITEREFITENYKALSKIIAKRLLTMTYLDEDEIKAAAETKEEIAKFILLLDRNKSIALLEKACDINHPLGKVFHAQRGLLKPSEKRGTLRQLNDELDKRQRAALCEKALQTSTKKIRNSLTEKASKMEIDAPLMNPPDVINKLQYPQNSLFCPVAPQTEPLQLYPVQASPSEPEYPQAPLYPVITPNCNSMQPNYDTGKHWIVPHYLAQPTAPSPSSQNSMENIVTLPVSASEEVIDLPPSYEVAVKQNPNKMTSNPFTLYTKEDHTVAILEEKLPRVPTQKLDEATEKKSREKLPSAPIRKLDKAPEQKSREKIASYAK